MTTARAGIRALIVDDEPAARDAIRSLLAGDADIHIVGECADGRTALRAIASTSPDLLFLDVQMPELDGFGVLREIGAKLMPAVIFVTAYDEFAVRAFDAHALDYLVKPLEEARFAEALERMRGQMQSAKAVDLSRKLAALLATREKEMGKQRILAPTSTGEVVINVDEIDWIEADDYYAVIHVLQESHFIRESLASLEQRLDNARFIRVHRSAIVNLDHMREVRNENGETWLLLANGTRVPVSRRRRTRVLKLLRRLRK